CRGLRLRAARRAEPRWSAHRPPARRGARTSRACSVVLVLGVGLAVGRFELLLDATRIAEDRLRGVLVAVRGVLDQVGLGELEALGLPAAGLLDRTALLAP